MKQLQFSFIDESDEMDLLYKIAIYRSPTEAAEAMSLPRKVLFKLINKYTGRDKLSASDRDSYKKHLDQFLLDNREKIFEEI